MNLDVAAISQRVEARRRVLLDSTVVRRLGGTTGSEGAYLSPDATTSLLRAGVAAFHASLRYGEGVVTAAAIVPERDGTVSIHIASSSPGKKPVLFREASALIEAAEEAAFSVVGVYAYLPRREYVRLGEVDPAMLFHRADIQKGARRATPQAPRRYSDTAAAAGTATGRLGAATGESADTAESAAGAAPDAHSGKNHRGCLDRESLETLVGRHKLPAELEVGRISELLPEVLTRRKQRVQAAAVRVGKIVLDEAEVVRSLEMMAGATRYYLDFETTASPVPEWDGLKPWEHMPMMFSLLEVEGPPEAPEIRRETVFTPGRASDPRETLADRLAEGLVSKHGPIIVFDDGLERKVLSSLAGRFEHFAPAAEQIAQRIVDISTPFRGFFVYHPDQCGKASLKVLLRIYGDDEYKSLAVADGRLAHDLLAAAAGGMLKAEEEGEVLRRLSTYVAQDTNSLVTLHGALARLLDDKDAWIPPPSV